MNVLRALTGCSFSTSKLTMAEATSQVQQIIDENAVVVFSKSYCPYCASTKSLMKKLNVDFALFELDQLADGSAWQNALESLTGQRTVPNVFIGKQHIGGNSELQAVKKSGELEAMLSKVGAVH